MEKITAIKGIKDILPKDSPVWHRVELTARRIFECFGFCEIRVPIMEKTSLFQRGIGETTDIVEKEMYTFRDRDDELLTLRPEATASVIRAYIEHNLSASDPVTRLYTMGPMFRRERPQKGRFRQFHQIDVELFGDESPASDAEVIFMLMHFLQSLNIENLSLEINSLGCKACRPVFSRAVVDYLKGQESSLCPDCRRRMDVNPLRVFDCKVESCGSVIAGAPRILDFLCADCLEHFSRVKSYLNELKLTYEINPRMVRGLDYYTRTAFEVKSGELGAQNSLAGGGRYNGLLEQIGGKSIPAIGFAGGFERLLLALEEENVSLGKAPVPDVFVIPMGAAAFEFILPYLNELRKAGVFAELDPDKHSFKAQLKAADNRQARYALIVGETELAQKSAVLKDLNSGEQKEYPLEPLSELIDAIRR